MSRSDLSPTTTAGSSHEPIIKAIGLVKSYGHRGPRWRFTGAKTANAVDGVDLDIPRGQTLGLVGESGSGKTTLGRMIAGLERPTEGRIIIDGEDWSDRASRGHLRERGRCVQMVFQEPFASLDPRMRVGEALAEGMRFHGTHMSPSALQQKVAVLLEQVGLAADAATRFPGAFSGGQLQRLVIARALAVEPKVLVCDEPVSALDVSVQAQIIELLRDLQDRLGLTILFISHDLAVVRELSHRIAVMYDGQIMELGNGERVFERSLHPYTIALISAAPVPDPSIERERIRITLQGELPRPENRLQGCVFATRCWMAEDLCRSDSPLLSQQESSDHHSRCHFTERL